MGGWKQNPRVGRSLGNMLHPSPQLLATPRLGKPLGTRCAEDLQAQYLICLRNSFQRLRILPVRKFSVVKFKLLSHPLPQALSLGGDGQTAATHTL